MIQRAVGITFVLVVCRLKERFGKHSSIRKWLVMGKKRLFRAKTSITGSICGIYLLFISALSLIYFLKDSALFIVVRRENKLTSASIMFCLKDQRLDVKMPVSPPFVVLLWHATQFVAASSSLTTPNLYLFLVILRCYIDFFGEMLFAPHARRRL